LSGSSDPAESTSLVTRYGRSADSSAVELGPLADLVGTWFGQGWSVGAVPNVAPSLGTEGFTPINEPFVEMLSFEALGAPVPNRGTSPPSPPPGAPCKTDDLFIAGLMYETRISNSDTHQPMHLENGMWLNLGATQTFPLVRQASIPHGDVLLAQGTWTTAAGPPHLPPSPGPNVQPTGQPPGSDAGYFDDWHTPIDGFVAGHPAQALIDAVENQTIVSTTELEVTTENGGGILSIPFVEENARTPTFRCRYWIETVEDPTTHDQFMQLQYWQETDMFFLTDDKTPAQPINWPHVQVNTLVKQ
jgi:hypothetical protein